MYGWERSFAEKIVQDDKDYINGGILPIGGEEATIKSPECQKLDDEDPFLWDSDWDAMLQAYAGNGTVELGHYGRDLTITDGKSMNATFSGKWGEEGIAAGGSSEPPLVVDDEVEADAEEVEAEETESASPTLVEMPLPTDSSDAMKSLSLPPGETTAVISWVETRRPSPTACVKAKKNKRSKLQHP